MHSLMFVCMLISTQNKWRCHVLDCKNSSFFSHPKPKITNLKIIKDQQQPTPSTNTTSQTSSSSSIASGRPSTNPIISASVEFLDQIPYWQSSRRFEAPESQWSHHLFLKKNKKWKTGSQTIIVSIKWWVAWTVAALATYGISERIPSANEVNMLQRNFLYLPNMTF